MKVFASLAILSMFLAMKVDASEIMRVEPLAIVTAKGTTMFSAEIADTEALMERGLMFRQVVPEDEAMLFDFNPPRPVAMWMKNTLVPLDMLFVRADGSIAAMAENTIPESLDAISVQEPVRAVIEVAAGTVQRLGIRKEGKVIAVQFGALPN